MTACVVYSAPPVCPCHPPYAGLRAPTPWEQVPVVSSASHFCSGVKVSRSSCSTPSLAALRPLGSLLLRPSAQHEQDPPCSFPEQPQINLALYPKAPSWYFLSTLSPAAPGWAAEPSAATSACALFPPFLPSVLTQDPPCRGRPGRRPSALRCGGARGCLVLACRFGVPEPGRQRPPARTGCVQRPSTRTLSPGHVVSRPAPAGPVPRGEL